MNLYTWALSNFLLSIYFIHVYHMLNIAWDQDQTGIIFQAGNLTPIPGQSPHIHNRVHFVEMFYKVHIKMSSTNINILKQCLQFARGYISNFAAYICPSFRAFVLWMCSLSATPFLVLALTSIFSPHRNCLDAPDGELKSAWDMHFRTHVLVLYLNKNVSTLLKS